MLKPPFDARALPHAFRPVLLIGGLTVAALLAWLVGAGLTKPGIPLDWLRNFPVRAADGERLASMLPAGRDELSLQKLLDQNLAQYKATIDDFNDNIRVQALLIVLALLLIIRRTDSLNLLGNSVPLSWLHLLLPMVMIYYWLSFGFILDSAIETRLSGVTIIEAIDRAPVKVGPVEPTLADSFTDLGKSLYQDAGFIDGWFITYVDTYDERGEIKQNFSGINHNFSLGTALFLVLVLGTFLSVAHACMIALCTVGSRRYLSAHSASWLSVYYCAPLVPVAFLLASHIQFVDGGENRNWIQLYIAVATLVFTTALLWLSMYFDAITTRGSLGCLRRQCVALRGPALAASTARSRAHDDALSIALIGDSLSTSFHLGTLPGMLWRMWRAWRMSWFSGIESRSTTSGALVERLARSRRVNARHHGTVSAMVGEPTQRSLIDRVCNRWHFHHQVDEVLAGELPDVILIWIGHNNVDWVERIPQFHDHAVDHVVEEFQRHFTGQLERLLTRARERTRPTSIVVFGLVNFRAFFRARNRARSEHTSNPDRFPYIDKGHHYFESMKPANTDRMVQLADMYNDSIAGACSVLSVDLPRNLRLVYSDALARVDISESRLISEWDAWHPSRSGHEALATSCLGVVERELEIRAETLQEVETA